jgi:hypothetical protein
MYWIFFERPCSKSITATYTIFNREHAGVTPINMCEFRNNQRIFTGVIVQTDRWTDRQTDKPKSLTLFHFSWKVLKTINHTCNILPLVKQISRNVAKDVKILYLEQRLYLKSQRKFLSQSSTVYSRNRA